MTDDTSDNKHNNNNAAVELGGLFERDSDVRSSCDQTARYESPHRSSFRPESELRIHITSGGSIPATPDLGPGLDGPPVPDDDCVLATFSPVMHTTNPLAQHLVSLAQFQNDDSPVDADSPKQSRAPLVTGLLCASAPQAPFGKGSSSMGPDPLGQSQASLGNISYGSGVFLAKDIQFRQLWRSLVTPVRSVEEFLQPVSVSQPLSPQQPGTPQFPTPSSFSPNTRSPKSSFLGKGASGRVAAMRLICAPSVPASPRTHRGGSDEFARRPGSNASLANETAPTVAVKTIRGIDPRRVSECEALTRELKVLAAAQALPCPHPSILTARHVLYDTNNGNVHFILDLKRGNLSTSKPFPEPLAAAVAYAALDALAFLHDVMGFAHRDIKPDNILFDRSDRCDNTSTNKATSQSCCDSSKDSVNTRAVHDDSNSHNNNHNVTARSDIYLADWGLAEPTRFVSFSHQRGTTAAGSSWSQPSAHASHSGDFSSATVAVAPPPVPQKATTPTDVTATAIGFDPSDDLPHVSERLQHAQAQNRSSSAQSQSQHTPNPSSSHMDSAVEQALIDDFAGTTLYMAPERLQGLPHGAPSDVWSLGVTIARLVLGRHPFQAALGDAFHSPMPEAKFWGLLEIFCPTSKTPFTSQCSVASPIRPDEVSSENPTVTIDSVLDELAVSEGLKDFLRQCLHVSADQRPYAVELLEHPWLAARLGNTTHVADFIESPSYW